jgi:hypothetical protein
VCRGLEAKWRGCFGPCANLLDKSSVAQSLDRSLKGRLLVPLPVY